MPRISDSLRSHSTSRRRRAPARSLIDHSLPEPTPAPAEKRFRLPDPAEKPRLQPPTATGGRHVGFPPSHRLPGDSIFTDKHPRTMGIYLALNGSVEAAYIQPKR